MNKNKQLFFSHTWRPDNIGRNTHDRVYELVKKLRDNGWTTWFDEEDMGGNIDAAMAEGIDNADAILVCLTETYCKKVNNTAKNPRNRDNCLKEWTYANTRNKLLIPVIMEPCLLNPSEWPPGIVSLYLGSTLYIDATNDDLSNAVIFANKFLLKHGLQPNNKVQKLFLKGLNQTVKETLNNSKNKISSPLAIRKTSSPLAIRKTSSPLAIRKTSSPLKSQMKSHDKRPQPPNILPRQTFKSPRKIQHRPPPSLPSSSVLSPNTICNLSASTNSYIISHKKPPASVNRRISEINVFSNYTPTKNFRKSKSTGNFMNLCI